MKQDVTVEGIPTHIDHNHDIIVELVLSPESAKQIKDVGVGIIAALTAGFVIKQTSTFFFRNANELAWKFIWKK